MALSLENSRTDIQCSHLRIFTLSVLLVTWNVLPSVSFSLLKFQLKCNLLREALPKDLS